MKSETFYAAIAAMQSIVGEDIMCDMLELQQMIFSLDKKDRKKVMRAMVKAGKEEAAKYAQTENNIEEVDI